MPEYAATHSPSLQDAHARLDKTSQAFLRRLQAGEKAGFRRDQGRDRWHSFTHKTAVALFRANDTIYHEALQTAFAPSATASAAWPASVMPPDVSPQRRWIPGQEGESDQRRWRLADRRARTGQRTCQQRQGGGLRWAAGGAGDAIRQREDGARDHRGHPRALVPAAPAWRRVQLRPDRRGGASSPGLKAGGLRAADAMKPLKLRK